VLALSLIKNNRFSLQLRSAKPATILDYITGTAVLEFGPAETLPQIGATSPAYARLCPPRHLHARTPAREAGVLARDAYFP